MNELFDVMPMNNIHRAQPDYKQTGPWAKQNDPIDLLSEPHQSCQKNLRGLQQNV